MAIGEIVKPREIVKANNELFRCKYKIKDVVAGRIFMAFASLVDHKDVKENQNFVEYKISADSILPDTCDGGDNYQQLREAANVLVGHAIEQHKEGKNFVVYALFSKISYEDGILTGQFHKDLVPFFIIAREKFTKMKLDEYMKLPSIYSQCIFGFLKSWSDRQEVTIKMSELHTMLDTPQSIRKNFAEFKRRVLDKAHKDINEKTSLSFEWEAIKNGRSFSEIKFKFIKNQKNKISKNNSIIEITSQEAPIHNTFIKFLNKFKNDQAPQSHVWQIWYELYKENIAPLDIDVPEDNTLGVISFLDQWHVKKIKNKI